MVSVRSALLPIYSDENRPLRSTVSNGATSPKNSVAHTPTVNAASGLAVADTILQFLTTLRQYPDFGDEQPSKKRSSGEDSDQGQSRPLLLQRSDIFSVSDSSETKVFDEHHEDGFFEKTAPSRTKAGSEQTKPSEHSISSLLFELTTSPENGSIYRRIPVGQPPTQESFPEAPKADARRSYSENFIMSQASIALMFGLPVDEKTMQDRKSAPAQNDNRASARYRQQSPDSWGNPANSNIWSSGNSEGVTGSGRPQILRARFTDAGTYQFG